ncbi:MAG TPA: thiolase family protein [Dehalococcoidia bacterium]|jgi:acetyl-CoA C-acetyltransferase|nr:thiolase family protein [Dehalococcoidia bacterium]
MGEVVLVSGARTAIGRFGGAFKDTPASDLAAVVIRAAVERAGIQPAQVDQVILGCVGQVMEDAYIARHAAVKAGIPIEVPAYTVNRICGSGLEAINTAARWIECGDAEVVVAGGVENMSMQPYYVRYARFGYRLNHGVLEDGIQHLLGDPFSKVPMGITAENLAEKFGVSRQEQDEVALRSQERAARAIAEGRFRDEIVPVEVRNGRETVVVDTDEHPRQTTLEKLAALKPAFKEGGSVTAGNASGINDGAAAVVVMSRKKAEELGVKPRLRMVARAEHGVEPSIMGSGPIPAIQKVMKKAGLTVDQMDVIELNEAFASVAAACSNALRLDPEKTNPNGGAIALGHPIGATGAILTVKTMYELERRGGRYGLVSLCIGGGQGIATIFERVS